MTLKFNIRILVKTLVLSLIAIYLLRNTFPPFIKLLSFTFVSLEKFTHPLTQILLLFLLTLLFLYGLITAIHYSIPKSSTNCLQLVQNFLAHIVFPSVCRCHHISPTLCKLHWLPTDTRITFKIAKLTF